MEKEQKQITDDFNDDDKVVSDLNLWDYKEEKEIVCVVKAVDDDGQFGRTLIVDTKDGENITIPSLTALQTKLTKAVVDSKVKIVNLGLIRGKNGRDYYDFDVFIK